MTFPAMLARAAARYGEREAVAFGEQRASFRELHTRTESLARSLSQLGVGCGDNVALWLPNSIDYIVAFFSVARLGAVPVAVNSRYRSFELRHILGDSEAVALLMAARLDSTDYQELIRECCPQVTEGGPELHIPELPGLRHVAVFGEARYPGILSCAQMERQAEQAQTVVPEGESIDPRAPGLVFYTSGTTGLPKGCLLSSEAACTYSEIIAERLGMGEGDVNLASAPFFHMFGLYSHVFASMLTGARQVVVSTFDPGEALALIEAERVTIMNGVPAMFIALFNHPDYGEFDLSSLEKGLVGGGPCPPDIMERIIDPAGLGMLALNAYALTESGGPVTFTSPSDSVERRCRTVGKVIPQAHIKILDPETAEDLGLDRDGEIWIKNPGNMIGYYRNPEATADRLRDGWLRSGDVGRLDREGYVSLTGRVGDLIISGGFNVYPKEVEEFLRSHPSVQDVSVVGVPDERLGEVPMAFIIPKRGAELTEGAVVAYCRDRIANFKRPRYVEFLAELPMAGVGKVQKYRLKEMAAEKYGWDTSGGK